MVNASSWTENSLGKFKSKVTRRESSTLFRQYFWLNWSQQSLRAASCPVFNKDSFDFIHVQVLNSFFNGQFAVVPLLWSCLQLVRKWLLLLTCTICWKSHGLGSYALHCIPLFENPRKGYQVFFFVFVFCMVKPW